MEKSKNPALFYEDVYNPLPEEAVLPDTADPGDGRRRKLWDTYLADNAPSGQSIQEEFDSKAKHVNLVRPKRRRKRGKSRVGVASGLHLAVSRCHRKAAKITTPSPDARFKTFIPLKEMWTSYIDKLLNISSLSTQNYMAAATKLMKADLNGCPVVVQKSKCPSYIGVSGIIIQETRNMFVLITPTDQIKRIPKSASVFSVVLGKFVFSIHGNHFMVKPGERSSRKFKTKSSLDL